MIPVGTFDFSVVLYKMIDRKGTQQTAQPAVDAQRTIDLTPYFGEFSTIRTMKSVREPAGGFTFSFGDQMDFTTQDSVADLIEPMDLVEIRVSREPWLYASGNLPLLMRGFVSTVRRTETMTDDGTPQRTITVRGQDFGKLWLINHVYSELAFATESGTMSAFGMFAALGMTADQYKISDYVTALTQKTMNPKVDNLSAISQRLVPSFDTSRVGTTEGTLIPSVAGTMRSGSLWSILNGFIDRPWNELFIFDTEAAPQVVFREVPYKDITGKFIMPNATDPGTVYVDISEVIQLDASRTDDHVAMNSCYFNSVVQCLYHTPELTEALLKARPARDGFAGKFLCLMAEIGGGNGIAVRPNSLLQEVMRDESNEFSVLSQEDAHEFLVYCINKIHELISKKVHINIVGSPQTEYARRQQNGMLAFKREFEDQYSSMVRLFFGQQCNTILSADRRFCKGRV